MKEGSKNPGSKNVISRVGKKDVNLRKNGWLHFQIGLILSLMITYFTVEMTFPFLDTPKVAKISPDDESIIEEPYTINIAQPKPVIEEPLPELQPENSVKIGAQVKVVENSEKLFTETPNVVTNKNNDNVNLDLKDIKFEKEPEVFSILAVETVPLFPGCEKFATNEEKITCLSSALNEIISRNFNGSIGANYGLEGMQRINLIFKIDTKGNIVDIKARAPHPALEKEAKRVMQLVPQMIPGKQSATPVDVIFAQPIIFKIN